VQVGQQVNQVQSIMSIIVTQSLSWDIESNVFSESTERVKPPAGQPCSVTDDDRQRQTPVTVTSLPPYTMPRRASNNNVSVYFICSGVRQRTCLCTTIFNIFVNIFIANLKSAGIGIATSAE